MVESRKRILANFFTGLAPGLTLVETLVANVILCGSILAIGAINSRCLRETRLDSQYETAASFADRQLALIDYVGVDSFLQSGRLDGEFENTQVKYSWRANIEKLNIESLYAVTMTVTWQVQNHQHSVTVFTRLNAASAAASTTSQQVQTGG